MTKYLPPKWRPTKSKDPLFSGSGCGGLMVIPVLFVIAFLTNADMLTALIVLIAISAFIFWR